MVKKTAKVQKKRSDFILIFTVIALVCVGLLMVFSATTTESLRAGDPFLYLKKQLLYVAIGFLAMFIGSRIDYQIYRKYVGLILVVAFVMLAVVFIPFFGRSAGGAARWIDLSFFSFQPSEFAKLALVIYLADAIVRKGDLIKDFKKGLLAFLCVVSAACLLVLLQPDLGTAFVLFSTAFLMFYLGGARIAHLFFIFVAAMTAFFAASLLSTYRIKRLLAFVDPWKDPRGIGFHIIQSLIAVGSGGFFGLGLGGSRQKYLYLPEQYTDFIFAILCEEWGFIGAVAVVILFIVFISRGLRITRMASGRFGMLLSGGIISYIGLQAVVNMSVVIGISPTTGIPLPFISYGGTSLVVMLYAVGILLNISSNIGGKFE